MRTLQALALVLIAVGCSNGSANSSPPAPSGPASSGPPASAPRPTRRSELLAEARPVAEAYATAVALHQERRARKLEQQHRPSLAALDRLLRGLHPKRVKVAVRRAEVVLEDQIDVE